MTRSTDAGALAAAALPAVTAALQTFSAAEFATISAFCERLLPRDQDPGAIDLGVPIYIDRMLASPELATMRREITQVLPILDRQSAVRHGKPFIALAPEQQDGLIASWQHGRGGDQRFFESMLSLTLEGAFGAPIYGGNSGGRGFAMIGFTPGPPMPGMRHSPG